MKKGNKAAREDVKSQLQTALELADFECYSYSGRAMYGVECLAVNIDQVGDLVAGVLEYLDGKETDTFRLQMAFRRMKMDSMGLGTVVYFPGTKFSEDGEDEDEEDHEEDHDEDGDSQETSNA